MYLFFIFLVEYKGHTHLFLIWNKYVFVACTNIELLQKILPL